MKLSSAEMVARLRPLTSVMTPPVAPEIMRSKVPTTITSDS